ncbi:MAG: PAS domain-containing sensor histidine kinase, partial [Caulobacterales bacterium]|nr:PAS domain-containing sensor histidine kinase [Caulobacterales bacterium]
MLEPDVVSPPDDLLIGLDALGVGLLMADAEDVVRYANAPFRALFADGAEPVGRTVLEVFSGLGEAELAAWAQRRAGAEPASEAGDARLTDGRILHITERRSPPRAGAVMMVSDVTEERRRSGRLARAVEASTEGFAFFDAGGGLEMWNAGFSLALAGASGVAHGARLSDLLATARREQRISFVGDPPTFDSVAASTDRRDYILEHADQRFLRLRCRPTEAGGTVAVLTELASDRSQSETIAARGAALAEATAQLRESRARVRMQTASLLGLKEELFRAQRDAEEADRAKQAFIRTITHELRTPLNSIIGFAEIVEAEMLGPVGSSGYKDYAALVRDSGRRLLRIINRILDITRLEAGVADLSFGRERLGPMLREAAASAGKAAREAGVAVEAHAPSGLPDVLGEPEALRTIVDNLLDNAVAHTPAGGTVTVSAAATDGHVTLVVADTGTGIAPGDLARVMLPFEQAGTPERPSGEGVGLGLPVVKALAEAMGGAF